MYDIHVISRSVYKELIHYLTLYNIKRVGTYVDVSNASHRLFLRYQYPLNIYTYIFTFRSENEIRLIFLKENCAGSNLQTHNSWFQTAQRTLQSAWCCHLLFVINY